jgi:hypothetical protein
VGSNPTVSANDEKRLRAKGRSTERPFRFQQIPGRHDEVPVKFMLVPMFFSAKIWTTLTGSGKRETARPKSVALSSFIRLDQSVSVSLNLPASRPKRVF